MSSIITQKSYVPSHPGICEVDFAPNPQTYASCLIAKRDFKPHEIISQLEVPKGQHSPDGLSSAEKKWTTIQVSKDVHLDVADDLVYMNHSCDPSAIIDVTPLSFSVITGPKGIKSGEPITFFYPSTEWDMARPFDCFCGSANCLKVIKGARYLSEEQLRGRFINLHIWDLKKHS